MKDNQVLDFFSQSPRCADSPVLVSCAKETFRLILLSADSEARRDVAAALKEQGWQVTPVSGVDALKDRLTPSSLLICQLETTHELHRIVAQMQEQRQWLPLMACLPEEGPKHTDRALSGLAPSSFDLITEAIQAGAQAVLPWPFTPDDFARALPIAVEGMQHHAANQNASFHALSKIATLTPRERDVLFAMVKHGSNKAVANALNLSPRTVEIYRAKTMQRLGVDHIAKAAWYAFVIQHNAKSAKQTEENSDRLHI